MAETMPMTSVISALVFEKEAWDAFRYLILAGVVFLQAFGWCCLYRKRHYIEVGLVLIVTMMLSGVAVWPMERNTEMTPHTVFGVGLFVSMLALLALTTYTFNQEQNEFEEKRLEPLKDQVKLPPRRHELARLVGQWFAATLVLMTGVAVVIPYLVGQTPKASVVLEWSTGFALLAGLAAYNWYLVTHPALLPLEALVTPTREKTLKNELQNEQALKEVAQEVQAAAIKDAAATPEAVVPVS